MPVPRAMIDDALPWPQLGLFRNQAKLSLFLQHLLHPPYHEGAHREAVLACRAAWYVHRRTALTVALTARR